jgi:hypothetical protein
MNEMPSRLPKRGSSKIAPGNPGRHLLRSRKRRPTIATAYRSRHAAKYESDAACSIISELPSHDALIKPKGGGRRFQVGVQPCAARAAESSEALQIANRRLVFAWVFDGRG